MNNLERRHLEAILTAAGLPDVDDLAISGECDDNPKGTLTYHVSFTLKQPLKFAHLDALAGKFHTKKIDFIPEHQKHVSGHYYSSYTFDEGTESRNYIGVNIYGAHIPNLPKPKPDTVHPKITSYEILCAKHLDKRAKASKGGYVRLTNTENKKAKKCSVKNCKQKPMVEWFNEAE